MNAVELSQIYQWNYRPRSPRRPSWFTQWPHGNRIAVTFNIMHEWESVPRSNTVRKRAMSTGSTCLDFLALGAREYGANFGFRRLLNVLDEFDVKATVLTSGLMAELFPDTLKEAAERGHEIACHHWDQSRHPFDYNSMAEEREPLACARWATCHLAHVRAPIHSNSVLPLDFDGTAITAIPTYRTSSMSTAKN